MNLKFICHEGFELAEEVCTGLREYFPGLILGAEIIRTDAFRTAFDVQDILPRAEAISRPDWGTDIVFVAGVARLCRSLRNQGREERARWRDQGRLGYNYRLDEMWAALGLVQLARLPQMLRRRAEVAGMYTVRLRELPEIEPPYVDPEVEMSWFVYVVRVARNNDRDGVMRHLRERGVECRPYFAPIHLQPFYRQ